MIQGHKVLQGNLVNLAHRDLKVIQGALDHQEIRDQQVSLEPRGKLETQGLQVALVHQVLEEVMVLLAHLEALDFVVIQDQQGRKVLRVEVVHLV